MSVIKYTSRTLENHFANNHSHRHTMTVKLFCFMRTSVIRKYKDKPKIKPLSNYRKNLTQSCILHLNTNSHFLRPFLLLFFLSSAEPGELFPKCSVEHGSDQAWKFILFPLNQEIISTWSILLGKAQSF